MAALAVTVALVAPAVASASTLTVGSPLTASFPIGLDCTQGCTAFNSALAEPGANLTSPVSGTIVSWRMTGNLGGSSAELRVLRPASGGQYTGVFTSSPETPTGTGTSPPFSTDLPVKAGDTIGMDLPANITWTHAIASMSGSTFEAFSPPLANKTTASPNPGDTSSNEELGFNADVVPQPGVGAVTPSSGPAAGGTHVVIQGHDFTGATAVSFGGRAATSFTVDSDGAIVAVSPPAGAGTVDITVTTQGGTSPTSAADQFSYTPNPPAVVACVVPKLTGKKLGTARTLLTAAHCTLGNVKKPKHHKGKLVVKSQSSPAGTVLADGASVSIKLKPKPHHK